MSYIGESGRLKMLVQPVKEEPVELSIEEILDCATDEERQALARVLDTWSCSPEALVQKLQKRSLHIIERLARSTPTYGEILVKVADKHGIRRSLFETDEDLERRLIRSVAGKALSAMSLEQREVYVREMRSLVPHAASAGGMAIAQASGFGIYQMASTVVGALAATAGLKLPFLAYMAMSKAISVAIGPIGWLGLGGAVLYTLTKPDYNQLVAAIACIGIIRQRLNPGWEWQGYSKTEITRRGLKVLVLLVGMIWLIWVIRSC
jgi:uncharacterized protein YaaW (UPF0174 family)